MISLFSLSTLIVVICFLIALIVIQHLHYFNHIKELHTQWHVERSQTHINYLESVEELNHEWRNERKELLDRIQSPTFHEYKSAEIKTIKAQTQEEPQPKYVLE